MTTQTLIETAANKIGYSLFIEELDAIGWRGNYAQNPIKFLMDYINNNIDEDNLEAEQIVRGDMIHILNLYGFDFIGNEIVDIVPR